MKLLTALLLFPVLLHGVGSYTPVGVAKNRQTASPDYLTVATEYLLAENASSISNEVTWVGHDVLIRFEVDSADLEEGEYSSECYQLIATSVVKGDLNGDNLEDFAIKYIENACEGNMFGVEWLVFLRSGNKWEVAEDQFGGGKFSDVEDIVGIEAGQLRTTFTPLDETSMQHDTTAVVSRFYRYFEGKFVRIK